MKEIKFRSWNNAICEMSYPWILIELSQSNHNDLIGNESDYVHMQYTGLEDKSGREIYEGDVLCLYGGKNFEIRWNKKQWQLWRDRFYPLSRKVLENGEVIGNIYESPELLENNS